ncbi:MAG: TrkH family potassium uptake protein [Deltaproteobacteria bacterium]
MTKFIARLRPFQLLALGFLSYVIIGALLLSLPFSRAAPVKFVDNVFNVTSAMSTTGLATVSVADSYTFFGELVLLILFQLGGIGYMTVTSFIILSRGQTLSATRIKVLTAEFTLPEGFQITQFVKHIIVFTVLIEAIGTTLLFFEFRAAGVKDTLWSAVFHSVSAFATAGFSLNNNSLEDFRGNGIVNVTVALLCYLGAIGFIVLQDAFLAVRHREYRITFTSKVILGITVAIFFALTPLFYLVEPALVGLPTFERLLAAAFQVMTASSTAGFNTIPIGQLSAASLSLIIGAMIIGASPSGTGGGIKTTSISAFGGILVSTLKGNKVITFFGHEVPMFRLMTAISATALYIIVLQIGVFLLTLTEQQDSLKLMFEAASALGTVGLSMGITGELSHLGKWIVITLMFMGRVGPLTIGLALFHSPKDADNHQKSDLAT